MAKLGLSADEVLTTTRAVRRRLDLARAVDPDAIRECLDIALQAPTGSNRQNWHFVVVTDPATIAALGDVYRRGMLTYRDLVGEQSTITPADQDRYRRITSRVMTSSEHLIANIHRVPGMLIPCLDGRFEGRPSLTYAAQFGGVIPATWSFMLAARERGIGTCWTTVHLGAEAEAADVLGIPFASVTQVALVPFAYTIGTEFKPARREPLDRVLHWDRW